MTVFEATLNQTAFLLCFIAAGYLLIRYQIVPDNAHAVLSKLENYIFIPALVLGTFMTNFTAQTLTTAGDLLLGSLILGMIVIAFSLILVRFFTKDPYIQRIYLYGLSFSNFGFMGNAVVSALFPDIFLEYLIFTLPLWILIYLWGVPVLLMGDSDKKPNLRQRLKSFVNPMFLCTLLGIIIGLTGIATPDFLCSAVTAAGNCMSPVAMLLTGMTIAQYDLRQVLSIRSVYIVTILRLLVLPALFMTMLYFIEFSSIFSTCAICSLAMPLGLNTIIIPSALGKDTKVAAGMALVSHVLSCLTIPLIFAIFETLI